MTEPKSATEYFKAALSAQQKTPGTRLKGGLSKKDQEFIMVGVGALQAMAKDYNQVLGALLDRINAIK